MFFPRTGLHSSIRSKRYDTIEGSGPAFCRSCLCAVLRVICRHSRLRVWSECYTLLTAGDAQEAMRLVSHGRPEKRRLIPWTSSQTGRMYPGRVEKVAKSAPRTRAKRRGATSQRAALRPQAPVATSRHPAGTAASRDAPRKPLIRTTKTFVDLRSTRRASGRCCSGQCFRASEPLTRSR